MSNTNTGGPAFPVHPSLPAGAYGEGMTLRDYFAAKAMNAYWNDPEVLQFLNTPQYVAKWAYEIADAMLWAREQ